MATLPLDANRSPIPDIMGNWAAAQRVPVGTASTQSNVIGSTMAKIVSDTNCYYSVGTSPTASGTTSGSFFLAAGVPDSVILSSTAMKIAVIRQSTDGSLFILPAA